MKHSISHSNETVTIRIEIEAPAFDARVREVLARAEIAIEAAKEACQADTILKLLGQGPTIGNKIAIIKAVRNNSIGMGLKEAKDLVESAPVVLKTGVRQDLVPFYNELKGIGADVKLLTPDEAICDEVDSQ